MSDLRQRDIFDEAITCWANLEEACRKEIEEFLTQLFVQALTTKSVIQTEEINNASQNSNKTHREAGFALSSSVNSKTTVRT